MYRILSEIWVFFFTWQWDFDHLTRLIQQVSLVTFFASGLVNFLPPSSLLDKFPRVKNIYEVVIKFIAALAFNIRHQLPALDLEMLGFKKPGGKEIPPNGNP